MRIRFVIALAFASLLAASIAFAAEPGSLPATLELRTVDGVAVPFQLGMAVPDFEPQERPVLSLAGPWKKNRVRMDHDLSLSARTREVIGAIEALEGYRYAEDYDDAGWPVHVFPAVEPAMSGSEDEPPETYHDGVWYRRRVTIPADWAGRPVRLVCLGANYVFDLWVNGQWIGYHEGGYTPFAMDLTGSLRPGEENTLAIRVDKPMVGDRQDTVPSWFLMDWWSYAGVIQDLYLESPPPVHVVRADVVPEGYNGRMTVSVVVRNDTDAERDVTVDLRVLATDPDAWGYLTDPRPASIAGNEVELLGVTSHTVRVAARNMRAVRTLLKIPSPDRWTPAEPNLYVLETTATAEGLAPDIHFSQFGIRSVARENGKVRVNGRAAFLPGVARHEEWPDTGRTARWDRIRADLAAIKDLNALFLRSGHYPNHVYTYLLADRLGLAVYAEIPVYWMLGRNWEDQAVRQIHRQMFRELVLSNFNRPSILFWGLSNECPFLFRDDILAYNTMLADDVRANYPDGRLLSQSPAAGSAWPVAAPTQAPLDVAGWTLYYGVFYGDEITAETLDFLNAHAERYPDYPVVATEFGSWAKTAEQEAEQARVFSETWEAFAQKAALLPDGTVNEDGNLAACSWWCAFDWYTKNGLPDFVADFLQSMGLIRMDRAGRKPAADALAAAYAPYAAFGGLGPTPADYDDDDDPPGPADDVGDDDSEDDDAVIGDDDDDDGCG